MNGFSFVKDSPKYWSDCALILAKLMYDVLRPNQMILFPRHIKEYPKIVTRTINESNEELRSVVAVFRHADRTPK